MAGYHYKLQIVPNSTLRIIDEDYWDDEQPQSDMLVEFRKLLPKNTAWGETEEFRSDENNSVLYIWWECSNVQSIQFEYAPIVTGKDVLLDEILAMCKKYGCLLYSEETKSKISPCKIELWQDFVRCSRFRIYENRLRKFN